MFEDQSCRSVNFKKDKMEKNCEFLKDVSTEKPKLLLDDGDYDYYILITPNRVSMKNWKITPFPSFSYKYFIYCEIVPCLNIVIMIIIIIIVFTESFLLVR